MTEIYFPFRPILCSFLLMLFSFTVNAQLQAGFTTDKEGGCSPLTVAFTNTTTGASANAVYKWDFGNSNTAALPNAAATYITEQSYNITLTVTDAGKTSLVTRQVSVYKRPSLDFSVDTKKGCLPLAVNFTATATPGDGTISNYFWDFGDGNTLQTPSAKIQHTYNLDQVASTGLTVMNNYGCYTSIEKKAVQVLAPIQADFNTDNKVLCKITDPVVFTNNSTGPGALSYAWDFGDGKISVATAPSHVYTQKGTYTIRLTVSNADGCTSTNTQPDYINANNYAADFAVPPLICINNQVTITDKSSPVANSSMWVVDKNYICYWCPVNLFYTFTDTLAHSIQLINTYGGCMDTITKIVFPKAIPEIKPFITDIPIHCSVPATFNFKDTTKDVTSWLWNFNWSNDQPSATLQNPTYIFTAPYGHEVKLTVTNAAGCSAFETEYVYPGPPNVSIGVINTDYVSSCDSVHVMFKAYTTDSIVTYNWDFTDGAYSSLAQPAHTFTKEGDFFVKLAYVTVSGCSGNVVFDRVHVSKRHPFDFTASGTTICGNTPVSFHLSPASSYTRWDFGDGFGDDYEFNNNTFHQYKRDSTYTVGVIIVDYYGLCPDTLIKKDYIKVLAPFPKILSAQNTCDGLRNVMTFKDTSYKATGWEWDFGDGSSHFKSSTSQVVTHAYASTGSYKVVLTNTNAQCSVGDSTRVYVLFKQHPVLTSNVTSTCGSDISFLHLNNMETNPAPDPYFWYGNYYGLDALQYGDSTNYIGYPSLNNAWQNIADWTLTKLDPSKKDLRIISNSAYFDCKDTTNFIPLKINGVKAGFKIVESNPCFAYPVILQDTSKAMSSPIKKWEWDFGDGTVTTENKGGTSYHTYAAPGEYFVQLKVTDSLGCSDNTINYYLDFPTYYARPSGPKASFIFSPANVTPNGPITFINNTNTFTANSGEISYLWLFGDGSSSTSFEPSHSFAATGDYTVKLISSNSLSLCRDTFTHVISVKLINTQFSFTKSYVSNSTCPPVIVHFTNTSTNAQSVAWDFGDGSIADNQNNPGHTYYRPGKYKITMYGYGYNGTRDTTVDSITVRAPFATLKADKLSGCLSQTITLNAVVTNASYITWDFADGTIKQTTDTFAVHQYATPGLYNPSLILLDSGGCYVNAKLADTIIIDALTVALPVNKHYCNAASVFFDPTVNSVAAASFNQVLTYHWNFGTGNIADTANIPGPVFNYNIPGRYAVSLLVQSPYGCIKLATDSIIVAKGSAASIAGPVDICKGVITQFSGHATNNVPGITWKWDFGNGTTATQQNPSPVAFPDTGNVRISLVVMNDGCADTALHQVNIHSKPVISAAPQQFVLCLGNSLALHAGGGSSYSWSPVAGLDNSSIATPVASPVISTTYLVKVINAFGCSNTDSVNITVAQPFSIKVSEDKNICAGSPVALTATGAASYSWINNVAGLSDTHVGNPFATPVVTIQYTVVGYDAAHCFTDTAAIHINVHPLPSINHQPDVETLGGTPVQLQAGGSADIISWSWFPGTYLSCSDCAAPVSTPLNAVTYIATGATQFGCTVADTIIVKLICAISKVYVPSVFSPNNDGVNDVFTIQGTGVNSIKWLRIFNRWGEIVFEKSNSQVGDRSAGWDGTVKGAPASPGTYIYLAELTCESGEVFPLKGTVTIMR